jgi:hypothetical protein
MNQTYGSALRARTVICLFAARSLEERWPGFQTNNSTTSHIEAYNTRGFTSTHILCEWPCVQSQGKFISNYHEFKKKIISLTEAGILLCK